MNNKIIKIALLTLACAAPLQGMESFKKGYTQLKEVIKNNPKTSLVIGALTTGVLLWEINSLYRNNQSQQPDQKPQTLDLSKKNDNIQQEKVQEQPKKEAPDLSEQMISIFSMTGGSNKVETYNKKVEVTPTLQAFTRGYLDKKHYAKNLKQAQNKYINDLRACWQEEKHERTFLTNTLQAFNCPKEQLTQTVEQEVQSIKRGARYAAQLITESSHLSKHDFYAQINGCKHEEKDAWGMLPFSTIENYKETLQDMITYFYFIGCSQQRPDNSGFAQGSIFIKDPKGKYKGHFAKFLEQFKDVTTDVRKKEKSLFQPLKTTDFAIFGEKRYIVKLWDANNPWLGHFNQLLISFAEDGIWIKLEHVDLKNKTLTDFIANAYETLKENINLWSRYTEKATPDAPEHNYESVPLWELTAFKKIFPTCDTTKMTLGDMYTYAQETLKQNPKESLPIKTFILGLQCHYPHLKGRSGREIRITLDELALAELYVTQSTSMQQFLKDFIDLKHAVTTYQQYKTNPSNLLMQINMFLQNYNNNYHIGGNSDTNQYFNRFIQLLNFYKQNGILEQEIAYQPIFENYFPKIVFKEDAEQKENNEKMQKITRQVMRVLQEFKEVSTQKLKNGCTSWNIKAEKVTIPLKKSEKINHVQLRKYMEEYILDLQQTKGLRKTRELSSFGHECLHYNDELIMTMYGIAQKASSKNQEEYLKICTTIHEHWMNILEVIIPKIAEVEGKLVSTTYVNKEIIKDCIIQADKQYQEMIKFYTNIYTAFKDKMPEEWGQTYTTIIAIKETYHTVVKEEVLNFFMLFNSKEDLIAEVMHRFSTVVKNDLEMREKASIEHDWLAQAAKVDAKNNVGYFGSILNYFKKK